MEWDSFCNELNRVGITLNDSEDQMMWDGGDNTDIISVKNIYNAIANTEWPNNITGWRIDFWKWKFPLKIKIFTWLTLKNKIPTWDLSSEKRLDWSKYMPTLLQGRRDN
jgi:hypothetical protein